MKYKIDEYDKQNGTELARFVIKKALEESSAAHNSRLYLQELVAKIKQFFICAADFVKKV